MKKLLAKRLYWPRLENVLFHLALILTFLGQSMLWSARAGWMIIGIIAAKNIRLAYYASFFYAAFFISSGFADNLFFTLKHYHIIVVLIFFIEIIHNDHKSSYQTLGFISKLFMPLSFLLGVGALHVWQTKMEKDELLFIANILTTGTLSLIVTLFFSNFLEEKGDYKDLQIAINYFSLGIASCVIVALFNLYFNTGYFDNISLFHNNHLGFFCNLAFFHTLVLLGIENDLKKKILNFILVFILFLGIISSCSRTTWISFFIVFILFMAKIYYLRKVNRVDSFWLHKKGFLVFCVMVIAVLCFFSDNIWERFYNLPQLIDPEYWRYTLNDHQNFGFLGIYRMRDLDLFLENMKNHFILGVGFSREIRDMHGLHFVILAGSGILGYTFFLIFLIRYFLRLQKIVNTTSNQVIIYIAIACQSTWLVWIFTSIMETFILQFSLWINVVISTIIIFISEQNFANKKEDRLP